MTSPKAQHVHGGQALDTLEFQRAGEEAPVDAGDHRVHPGGPLAPEHRSHVLSRAQSDSTMAELRESDRPLGSAFACSQWNFQAGGVEAVAHHPPGVSDLAVDVEHP